MSANFRQICGRLRPVFPAAALSASRAGFYLEPIIKAALKAGATMEEVMEVMKLCVVQGVQACNLGVPILAEELERAQRKPA